MGLFRHSGARHAAEQIAALRHSVAVPPLHHSTGLHRMTVMCPKGGAGKTTTAALLASALAELRGEITAVLDANLHTGTLRRRLVPPDVPVPAPMIALAAAARAGVVAPEWPQLAAYSDLVGRLRVFSNQNADPALVEAMTAADYTAVLNLVSRAAQLVVADMGTSVTGPVAVAALDATDTLVVATELAQDTLELTIEMVSALAGQPMSYRPDPDDYASIADGRYAGLVANAVVAVAPGRDDRDPADFAGLLDWLRAVCAQVICVPRDPALAGDLIDAARLSPSTVSAQLRIAAHIAGRFPHDPSRPAAPEHDPRHSTPPAGSPPGPDRSPNRWDGAA